MKGEMEMMMEGDGSDLAWMDYVERSDFMMGTIAVGFVALALAGAPTLLWHLYIMPQAESMSITKTTSP